MSRFSRDEPARPSRATGGYALLAVLWISVVLSVLVLVLVTAGRAAIAGASFRVDAIRNAWRAEGCAQIAIASLDSALSAPSTRDPEFTWARLDRVGAVVVPVSGTRCGVALRPAGRTIDINQADSLTLLLALVAAGSPADTADVLVASLLDWRDGDRAPRPSGAEAAWYRARGRPEPSNRPFEHVAELRLVRGFESISTRWFGTEDEPIALSHADPAVLAAMPGMGPGAVRAVERLRARGRAFGLGDFFPLLSEAEGTRLRRAMPRLRELVRPMPTHWWLDVHAPHRDSTVSTLRLKLARRGDRILVTERRSRSW